VSQSRWRVIFLTALGAFLVWEVITRSLAAYFADASPEMALRLRSTEPIALLNLADDRLNLNTDAALVDRPVTPPRNETNGPTSDPKALGNNQAIDEASGSTSAAGQANMPPAVVVDSQTRAQIRSWAEKALLNDPLNARTFRILGQLSQSGSNEERTKTLMQAAARRSLLESLAIDWMMRKSYRDKDYAAAMRYADTLIRTRPQLIGYVMPILGKMAETPDASVELKQVLASNPGWRPQFLSALPSNISDARTPLDVLLTLKETANPPTAVDLRPYLDFLISHGFHELAYYTWLQFLPPEQLSKAGHLLNSGFEATPSGLPFDWIFNQGPGVKIQIGVRPDQEGQHALFTEFGPGRVDSFGVTQMIMLTPGSYKFLGQYRADLVSERGLKWLITCAGVTTPIGESSAIKGTAVDWKNFDFSFTVPAADCPAQYASLTFDARSASERFISGSVWFDDLQITREPTVDSSSAQ
jgi:hypothetical protein